MHNKLLLLLTALFLLSGMNHSYADPKMPKRCAKKVLLPGQKKPMRFTKARKLKNNYF